MDLFFPFIYEPKQNKEFEPESIYIEEYIPTLEEIKEHLERDEESYIVIIDM